MKQIDINVDVGEGFPDDVALLQLATSANICCGAHAGSPELALDTARFCRVNRVRIGAHPGVPDRSTMGRSPIPALDSAERDALLADLLRQVEPLLKAGAEYVKPHGELYNASCAREDLAEVVSRLIAKVQLPLMGLAETLHLTAAARAGVAFIREGFADRAYDESHRLVPRSKLGAVLSDPMLAARNALALADRVDSICVHGDSPGCVEMLSASREALESAGYVVTH